ncbi:hypothetical protein BU16DRAFT_531121 [Lophium mytilinum]|uniref:Uncharacterized protein n=1 Tax=Lophium mytilinum TaxID=390894 RepID=A0A6A6QDP9_9PEZI|nr:hypothetical protein BU16DRAFT_531121 [Lophium mytilinum]
MASQQSTGAASKVPADKAQAGTPAGKTTGGLAPGGAGKGGPGGQGGGPPKKNDDDSPLRHDHDKRIRSLPTTKCAGENCEEKVQGGHYCPKCGFPN